MLPLVLLATSHALHGLVSDYERFDALYLPKTRAVATFMGTFGVLLLFFT